MIRALLVVLLSASASYARPDFGPGGPSTHTEASVTLSPTRIRGALPQVDVERVVKARKGIYRACYQKELNRHATLAGKLSIKFTVSADGTVTSAVAGKQHSLGQEVESCITRNIERLKFPVKTGATTASVTMTFRKSVVTTP